MFTESVPSLMNSFSPQPGFPVFDGENVGRGGELILMGWVPAIGRRARLRWIVPVTGGAGATAVAEVGHGHRRSNRCVLPGRAVNQG